MIKYPLPCFLLYSKFPFYHCIHRKNNKCLIYLLILFFSHYRDISIRYFANTKSLRRALDYPAIRLNNKICWYLILQIVNGLLIKKKLLYLLYYLHKCHCFNKRIFLNQDVCYNNCFIIKIIYKY